MKNKIKIGFNENIFLLNEKKVIRESMKAYFSKIFFTSGFVEQLSETMISMFL